MVLGGLPEPADLGKAVIAAGQQAGRFIGTVAQAGSKDGAALDGALADARRQLHDGLGC